MIPFDINKVCDSEALNRSLCASYNSTYDALRASWSKNGRKPTLFERKQLKAIEAAADYYGRLIFLFQDAKIDYEAKTND